MTSDLRRTLHGFDIVVLGYVAIVTAIVFARWSAITHPGIYLAYHGAVVAMIGALVYADRRYGGRFWGLLRHWYPLLPLLAAFREIHYLAPEVQPFDSMLWDIRLEAVDIALFGDVATWLRALLWPPLVEFLTYCYWLYYPLPLLLAVILWRRENRDRFVEFLTILLFAWFLSYLGYFGMPTLGPHVLETTRGIPRDIEWEGSWLAGKMFRALLVAEKRMPDAFPSGHTLAAVLCILAAFRYRILRGFTLFVGIGIVLATVYLRYHYIADVLASFVLVPLCWYTGLALHRRCSPGEPCGN